MNKYYKLPQAFLYLDFLPDIHDYGMELHRKLADAIDAAVAAYERDRGARVTPLFMMNDAEFKQFVDFVAPLLDGQPTRKMLEGFRNALFFRVYAAKFGKHPSLLFQGIESIEEIKRAVWYGRPIKYKNPPPGVLY